MTLARVIVVRLTARLAVMAKVVKAGYASLMPARNIPVRGPRSKGEQTLAELIRAGLQSGVATRADARYWKAKRARLRLGTIESRRKT